MKFTLSSLLLLAMSVSGLPNYGSSSDLPSTYGEDVVVIKEYHPNRHTCRHKKHIKDPNAHVYGGSIYTPKTYTVKVGGADENGNEIMKYDPPVVYANKGDRVIFDFLSCNSTVTESTFSCPCERKTYDSGIASGFRANPEHTPGKNTFEYIVEDEKPHWIYNGQKEPENHCKAGMVMAINPPKHGDFTYEKFLEIAMSAEPSDYEADVVSPKNSESKFGKIFDPEDDLSVYDNDPSPSYGKIPELEPSDDYPSFSYPTTDPESSSTNTDPMVSYSPTKPTNTRKPSPKTYKVQVGEQSSGAYPTLIPRYTPSTISAQCGDIIEFHMRAAAQHTVTQSSFEHPCQPLPNGFQTGPQSNVDGLIVKEYTVAEAGKALWFFGGAPGDCRKGMVFAVNDGGRFDEFQRRAMGLVDDDAVGYAAETEDKETY